MTMFSPSSTRKRGVTLTTAGWKKLQQAISTAEFKDNHGERYTFDRLGERTSLDPATIAKVLERQKAVDRRTLGLFFQSFGLELDDDDHSQKRLVPTDRRQHWGQAVDVSVFYGRTAELAELENWVVEDRCRLVMLLGMGGIGKTTLSVKLAERVQDGFEHVIWRSLRNAPLLQDILVDLLECLSSDQHTSVPTTLDGKISRLTDHLRNQRCLLILDNVETILCGNGSAGYYREGYEEYGSFFKGLAEVAHQSCLMLTSREKPAELGVLEGRTRPVRVYQLCGITEAEGQQILEAKDLTISESNPDWKVLIAHYSGNPLALQIVATMIRELLDSDIGAFVQLLRRGTIIFDDIRDLLEQQFRRLSEFEKEVVYWIAIEREGVELSILREDIAARVPDTRLWEALRSLGRRSLVVRSGIRFTLQPVLMEYASDRLVEQVSSEIINRKIALIDSHALIKAQAADDVREAQTRLLLKPLVDRLLATFGSRPAIERRLAELLSDLRRVPRQSGYAAGNLLNLLCHLKANLSGYDFSGLPIRQADLRDVALHGVNFSHCHLERSAFSEAFGSTLSLAFSPDGSLLATGDIGGEIHLWRVRDGRQLSICRGHTDCVWSVAFSPDGKTLASGSMDQSVRLWDTATGQCSKILKGHANLVGSVAFGRDGRTLASGSRDTTIKLWDITTGECRRTLSGHGGWVSSVSFSPDGQTLASGSADQTVRLWDSATGECCRSLTGHSSWVWSVAFGPDGRTLASGSQDGSVRLWDSATGECRGTLAGHSSWVWSVAFGPDGRTLASGSRDTTIKLWDITTGQCQRTLSGHGGWVSSVSFSPDGQTLASSSVDQTVRFWHIRTGQCHRTLRGYANWVLSVAFSLDGRTLASGSQDGSVRLWDSATGEYRGTSGHSGWVLSVAFDPDGRTLASGSQDGSVQIWDARTAQHLRTCSGHTEGIWSVAFTPDGQTLASGAADQTVRVWDALTGRCLRILQGHTGWVRTVVFSPDGLVIASGSADGNVRLWDAGTGECLRTLAGHTNWVHTVAFSPDGRTLASGGEDGLIRFWNVQTGLCQQSWQGEGGGIWSVSFSPDGLRLAFGCEDGSLGLYDIATGSCLHTWLGHASWVYCVAFRADAIASCSQDETIRVWDAAYGSCTQVLRVSRPYEGLDITGVTGLTEAQKMTLVTLGAVELSERVL